MRKKLKIFYLLLLLMPVLSYAQQTITVKGVVKDDAGEALIGVSVQVADNPNTGAITDIDGAYSIAVNPKSSLVFSYLGYMKKTVPINGKTIINVVMESDLQELDEIVVIAYGTQKKLTITGAVTDITTTELLKSPTASLANAISGKLPGLTTIQYSGLPGSDDPVLLIRGVNSLSVDGSSPLILVDGVPRSFTQIDPNEVESISILKDASATAVYGVRGANGVILVTTKRGESGKTRFSFTSSYGIQQPTNFINFTDSYQYATAFNASQRADGVAENDLKFSQSDLNHFKTGDSPLLYPSQDWISYVMKNTAPQSQYNLNISGGGDRTRYFISLGRFDQDGLFNTFDTDLNSNFRFVRYNYRTNLDVNIGNHSILSFNLGGRTENRTSIGGGGTNLFTYLMDTTPMSGAGIVDGKRIVANGAFAKIVDRDGLNTFYGQGYSVQSSNVLNADLNYLLKLDFITPGLNFKIKGSYNSNYAVTKSRTGSRPTYMPVLSDPTNPNSEVVLQKNGDITNPGYGESSSFGRDWYAETSFDYSHSFGPHNFTALLLYNQAKRYYPGSYEDIPTGYIGLVGRVTYNYMNRYLLDMNVGYNGSENFAPGKRYGTFPSISAGWVVTSEKFMENQQVINYLKIRYSYGLVGNDGYNRFLYIPGTYAFNHRQLIDWNGWQFWYGGTYNFGTNSDAILSGAYQQSEGYPDVTWEKSTKQNLGVDLKILKNRLGFTANFFKEHRNDILVSNSSVLPGPVALPSQQINHGIVDSHGYELQLSWADNIGKDFRYMISPNLSFSRNKIIEQLEVPQNYPWLYRTGHPVSQPFGYEFFGFYRGAETETAYKEKYGVNIFPTQMVGSLQPGDAVYVDLSGDGRITSDDKHAIGYPEYPEYTLGTGINLSYKGFDINMTWLGATNVSRYLGYEGGGSGSVWRPYFGPQQRSALPVWIYENAWTEENKDEALVPRFSFMSQSNNVADSKVWLIDASYLRLKNLEIGYNFPRFKKLDFIKGLRIYVNGSNLLTFSHFNGNDPENNGRIPNYPQMKVYNFGLRVDF
ncbi:MAG: TonB-dependent receptor [Dysgonamonadaceae bacterium]|jgi:TonB-linked SusC/RagA family outer membrane protein|nr:TonB-dependent receptor [Dysgonamonadaceae bacterium]